jgi:hypothetical protein
MPTCVLGLDSHISVTCCEAKDWGPRHAGAGSRFTGARLRPAKPLGYDPHLLRVFKELKGLFLYGPRIPGMLDTLPGTTGAGSRLARAGFLS